MYMHLWHAAALHAADDAADRPHIRMSLSACLLTCLLTAYDAADHPEANSGQQIWALTQD